MYISNIRISNFRNFKKFSVDLNNGLSIIIGENNAGKSNFIEAVSLIFNSDYSMRKRVLQQDDFWNDLKVHGTWPEIIIEATIQEIITEDELAITSRWLTRNPGEAKLTYKYRPKANISVQAPKEITHISKLRLPLNEYEWVIYGGEYETLDSFDFNMLSKFGIEYVEALRDATTEMKKSSGRLQRILRSYDLETKELQEISTKIDQLNSQIMKGKEISSVQISINSFLEKITGATKQKIKLQMGESDYNSLLKELKVVIGTKEGKEHTVEKNGLGYNNLLYISLLLTQYTVIKEKRLQNHDYIFPILIVEEPEAHLHSHMQKFLAKYFFNQKVAGQIIMTSHSSHVSSHSNLDNLIMFYKKNEMNLSSRIGSIFDLRKKEQKQYKRYLERWLDATKSDIFFARKVLLVEGIAERLLIPKFFSMIYKDKDLEGEGISVISVDGVAFRPFLHLFGDSGLDIKCVVLTDSDPESIPLKDKNGELIIGSNSKVLKEEVYPSKVDEYESSSRTTSLLKDFNKHKNIFISTNIKTFEYDLMLEENNLQFFVDLIDKYSIGSKESRKQLSVCKGQEFVKEAYTIISKEKGEFSQYILDELNDGKMLDIPIYIKKAFEFLLTEEGDKNSI